MLCGATGSAKTRVLQALAIAGEQVLDLEDLAAHKGSVLGGWPGRPQPSQKAFETQLAAQLKAFDLTRPVYVEAESRRIGRITLSTALLERLRASPCIEIAATAPARLAHLLHDYAYLGDDGEALAAQIGLLHGLQANETLERWQAWARQHQLPLLFEELMRLHYDPLYGRSQHSNFLRLTDAQRVETDTLDEAALPELARQVARLGGASA